MRFGKTLGTCGIGLLAGVLSNVSVAFAAGGTAPALASPTSALVNLGLSLLIVILLVVVLARWFGRRTRVATRGDINVVAARQVAPNRSVQVIEYEGRHYLIGVGETITLLSEDVRITAPDAVGGNASHAFKEALEDARKGFLKPNDNNGDQTDAGFSTTP